MLRQTLNFLTPQMPFHNEKVGTPSFLSLVFSKTPRKTSTNQGFFSLCEPSKTLQNKQKTLKKSKGMPKKKNTKETKTTRERRTGYLGALKGTELRWQGEPKMQIFAQKGTFLQIHPFSWKSSMWRAQIFAENRRSSQKTQDFRREPQTGLRHLRSVTSSLALRS